MGDVVPFPQRGGLLCALCSPPLRHTLSRLRMRHLLILFFNYWKNTFRTDTDKSLVTLPTSVLSHLLFSFDAQNITRFHAFL